MLDLVGNPEDRFSDVAAHIFDTNLTYGCFGYVISIINGNKIKNSVAILFFFFLLGCKHYIVIVLFFSSPEPKAHKVSL